VTRQGSSRNHCTLDLDLDLGLSRPRCTSIDCPLFGTHTDDHANIYDHIFCDTIPFLLQFDPICHGDELRYESFTLKHAFYVQSLPIGSNQYLCLLSLYLFFLFLGVFGCGVGRFLLGLPFLGCTLLISFDAHSSLF
jgi:hypothetical protein